MTTFSDMGLSPFVLQSLEKMQISSPTPIQAESIPLSLKGQDILGSAQTGTGKTLAFSIPLVERLLKSPEATALVLAPTRELAQQVLHSVKQLTRNNPSMKTALLIGGESIYKQFKQLRCRPRIIVGTPGRVIDHLMRCTWDPLSVKFLVLDETDRMLDMGFGIQLEEIIPKLPAERQTLMFSATFPKNILALAGKYLVQPKQISIGATSQPAAKIKQEMLKLSESQKYPALIEQLGKRDGSIIVFVKTKMGAERLANKLIEKEYGALAIHGDLQQYQRDKVIRAFRAGRQRIMVATDVAARGLDIPHIQHVINYDLPQCPEDYIHRIGRTARAGATGEALCFVTPQETGRWKAIHHYIEYGKEMPAERKSSSGRRFSKFSKKPGGNRRFSKSGESRSENGSGDGRRRFGRSDEGRSENSSGAGRRRFARSDEGRSENNSGAGRKRFSKPGESRSENASGAGRRRFSKSGESRSENGAPAGKKRRFFSDNKKHTSSKGAI